MQKTANCAGIRGMRRRLIKTLLVMKLASLLLMAAFLNARASGVAQKITLSVQNIELEEIFTMVKEQTGFSFFYDAAVLKGARRVTVSVKDAPLENFLQQVFEGQPLKYTIRNSTIALLPKPQTVTGNRPVSLEALSLPFYITVTGVVRSAGGNPLPGATVQVKGKSASSVTDEQGRFSLYADPGDVLVISYVGYNSRQVRVTANKTDFSITLEPLEAEEREVVITGYQALDSRRAAGAFGYVGASTLQNRPSVDLAAALDGMVTGLRVYEEAGSTRFDVRGIGTMTAAVSSPLIVIDGFPAGNGLSGVNPNDVQSIHVLKDAAAASIWGARASNGVIVITTKKAKQGLHINVNSFVSIREKPDLDQANPIAGASDALEWEKYLWENDKLFSSFSLSSTVDGNNNPASFGITLLNLRDQGRLTPALFEQEWNQLKQTDYRRDVNKYLLRNAVIQNYDLTISGASDRNEFVLNTRFVDDKSQFRNNYDRSLLVNFRNSFKITRWADFNLGLMANFIRRNNSGASLNDIKSISPYERLVNDDGGYARMVGAHYQEFIDSTGKYFPHDWNYNLLQEIRSRELKSEQNDIRAQIGFRFKVLKGLTYETRFQYEQYKSESRNYYSPESYYVRDQLNKWVDYDEANNKVLKSYLPDGGQLLQSFGTFKSYNFRNQLTYERIFGNHEITGGLISEIFSKINEGYSAPVIYGYNPDQLISQVPESYMIKSYWGGTNYQLSGMNSNLSYLNDRFFSLLGNMAYTYNRKYTLSGSFRIDASNLIVEDPKTRYSPFWSVGGNWRADQETFLESISQLDRLNLRLSYGKTGNVVLSTSVVPLIAISPVYPLTGSPYASITDYGNPNLGWEKTTSVNFGIDYALFNHKLFGSIDIYNKHGRDIVGAIDLPRLTGTTTQEFNTAEIINRGVELNIGTSPPVGKNFTWTSNMNFSYNKSKVLNLMLINYNYFSIRSPHFEEGKPVDAIYSYNYLGEDGGGIPTLQGIGNTTFTFNDVHPVTTDDRDYMQYSGSAQPTTVIGWQNGVSAFGFNLYVIVNGEFGHIFRRPTFNYGILTNSKASSTLHKDVSAVLNNTAKGFPNMPPADVLNLNSWGQFAEFTNTTIEKADNLRLKEVNLSYRIPARLLSSIGFTGSSVFFQVRAPKWIWVANDEKLDPMFIFNSRSSSSAAAVTSLRPATSYKLGISFGL